MEKGFNPTEENVVDLEQSIFDLKRQKAEVVADKCSKQLKVGELKDKLNDPKTEGKEFRKLTEKRIIIKNELSEIELKIRKINLEIDGKRKLLVSCQSHVKSQKNKSKSEETTLEMVKSLRDKYQHFSSDHTRVSSMRIMASQMVEELDTIIKTA